MSATTVVCTSPERTDCICLLCLQVPRIAPALFPLLPRNTTQFFSIDKSSQERPERHGVTAICCFCNLIVPACTHCCALSLVPVYTVLQFNLISAVKSLACQLLYNLVFGPWPYSRGTLEVIKYGTQERKNRAFATEPRAVQYTE